MKDRNDYFAELLLKIKELLKNEEANYHTYPDEDLVFLINMGNFHTNRLDVFHARKMNDIENCRERKRILKQKLLDKKNVEKGKSV